LFDVTTDLREHVLLFQGYGPSKEPLEAVPSEGQTLAICGNWAIFQTRPIPHFIQLREIQLKPHWRCSSCWNSAIFL